MKKVLVIILVISLIFLNVPSYAFSSGDYQRRQQELGTRSGVAVFFLGIVVAYIIDGIVIYETGVSIPNHIANAIEAFAEACTMNSGSVWVSKSGVIHGSSGGSFSVNPSTNFLDIVSAYE